MLCLCFSPKGSISIPACYGPGCCLPDHRWCQPNNWRFEALRLWEQPVEEIRSVECCSYCILSQSGTRVSIAEEKNCLGDKERMTSDTYFYFCFSIMDLLYRNLQFSTRWHSMRVLCW